MTREGIVLPFCRYVRFSGGPAMPTEVEVDPSPGGPIVDHLISRFSQEGVQVLGHEDLQYAHELHCQVGVRCYSVLVAFDWITMGHWEIFWPKTVGFIGQLFGKSEESELRTLAYAVEQALLCLSDIQEKRWYREYSTKITSETPYAISPG